MTSAVAWATRWRRRKTRRGRKGTRRIVVVVLVVVVGVLGRLLRGGAVWCFSDSRVRIAWGGPAVLMGAAGQQDEEDLKGKWENTKVSYTVVCAVVVVVAALVVRAMVEGSEHT